ncbi:MAG: ABC transporter permease [Acidobacteriaceae bacterium]|nr:ABC transporter permease [Acidobacteriaceae bacterium]
MSRYRLLLVLVKRRCLLTCKSRLLWALFLAVTILPALSALVTSSSLTRRIAVQHASLNALEDKLHDPNIHVYSQVFRVVSHPLPYGSIFFSGPSAAAPDLAVLHGRFGGTELLSSDAATPFAAPRYLPLDPAHLLAFSITLLGILYGAEIIAGEKEQGLLRLVLSLPVGRLDLLIAELTSVLIVLTIPVLLAIGLTAAALSSLPVHYPVIWTLVGCYAPLPLLGLLFATAGIAVASCPLPHDGALALAFAVWAGLVLLGTPTSSGLGTAVQAGTNRSALSEGILARANPTQQAVLMSGATPADFQDMCHLKATRLPVLPVLAYFRYVGGVTGTGTEAWKLYCGQIGRAEGALNECIRRELTSEPDRAFRWTENSSSIACIEPAARPDAAPWQSGFSEMFSGIASLLIWNGAAFALARLLFARMDVSRSGR